MVNTGMVDVWRYTKATRLSGYSLSTPGYALLPICMVLEGRNTVNIHIQTR